MGIGSQQCGPVLCSPLGLGAGRRLLGSTFQGPRKQDSKLSRRPVPATRGPCTHRMALSNPLPCGRSPCSLETVEGAVSASGGLFSIVYSEPQDKWCPCLPWRDGYGTLCRKSHWPGTVYVLIFSPLLPNTEDIFQRQVIDFSLALSAQSFISLEAMQGRDPRTTAQSSSILKQRGL